MENIETYLGDQVTLVDLADHQGRASLEVQDHL